MSQVPPPDKDAVAALKFVFSGVEMPLLARRLMDVPRWCIVPTIRKQNVDAHCFHVAWIAESLRGCHKVLNEASYRGQVLWYALFHDATESVTGDLPAPFKRRIKSAHDAWELANGLEQMPDRQVRNLVKCADLLEASLFLREELAMGNTRILGVAHDVHDNFAKAWASFEWGLPWPVDYVEKPEAKALLYAFGEAANPFMHPGLVYT